MKKLLIPLILFIIAIFIVSFKGEKGLPIANQYSIDTSAGSPFESTGTTSRYVLTKAIAERGSFFLTEQEAKAGAPDVVYQNGHFMTIFTPGVSIIAVPFYLLGNYFRFPQVFSFSMNLIVALINFTLIYAIARRLNANKYAAAISGLVFMFATNAFTYAHTLTQHHLSVLIILSGILLAVSRRNWITNLLLGLLFGVGLLIDIPNAIMLLPVMIYAGLSNISIESIKNKSNISIKLSGIFIIIGAFVMMSFYGYYNLSTTGSATLISQNIGRTDYFDTKEIQEKNKIERLKGQKEHKKYVPFDARDQLESTFILIFSNERGWIYYSPILLLGIIGAYLSYSNKKTRSLASLLIITAFANLTIYSMFGDPWGGWGFGPRYLIPGASILSIFIAVYITKYARNLILMSIFLVLFIYSLFVNSLGVYTTAQLAPKNEVETLNLPVGYTYRYNMKLVNQNNSSSYLFDAYLSKYINLNVLVYSTVFAISVSVIILMMLNSMNTRKEKR